MWSNTFEALRLPDTFLRNGLRLLKNQIYTTLLVNHFLITMFVSEELKRKLIASCLLFRDKNYVFNYRQIPTPGDLNEKQMSEVDIKLLEFKGHDLQDILDNLCIQFYISILFIYKDKKYKSSGAGPELFLRENKHLFWCHSNAGRITKLPAGVGKMQGPMHRLEDIINFVRGNKRTKIVACPLEMDTNLEVLEKKYKVAFEVWSKNRMSGSKYDIKRLRKCGKKYVTIKLHCDQLTGKLFLIKDTNLYFRGYLKTINKQKKYFHLRSI